MRVITVRKTLSTNNYLKDLHAQHPFLQPVCVYAVSQTEGRGQQGASWQSNAGENLTFSMLFPNINCAVKDQFKLNKLVSLLVLGVLEDYNIENLMLKWPNDIMADGKKLGGILIENSITKGKLKDVLVGIGLNVNQIEFVNLPKATSLKLQQKTQIALKPLLTEILKAFDNFSTQLHLHSLDRIKTDYEAVLFKKNVISVFENAQQQRFNGIIKGVNHQGQLLVETEDAVKAFGLKEISLKY